MLTGYALVSAGGRLGPSFQAMNLAGAGGLSANGAHHGARPSAALNFVWRSSGSSLSCGRAANRQVVGQSDDTDDCDGEGVRHPTTGAAMTTTCDIAPMTPPLPETGTNASATGSGHPTGPHLPTVGRSLLDWAV